MVVLENEVLRIEIAQLGAQLTRIFNKSENLEYLWNGNPKYWARHAPILFPIVGRLAENRYLHNGESYNLSQHGFARDQIFSICEQTSTRVSFRLEATEASLKVYPFAFTLDVRYELEGDKLTIDWFVQNPAQETLYFSIGAHPAFSTTLLPTDQFEDYVLEFTQAEDLTAMVLDPVQGLFSGEVAEVSTDVEHLALKYELFDHDALVFNNFQGGEMTLRCKNHQHGLTYNFEGFPYVAVWTPPKQAANFICLEPWYGYADTIEGPFEFSKKPAIETLEAKQIFKARQTMTFF
ncbi:MAG: aldose 1-epimerase family protein [Culicoidibacterales bacterium]